MHRQIRARGSTPSCQALAPGTSKLARLEPPAATRKTAPMTTIRALTFDVFGTVVDWRSSVIRECRQFGVRHGVSLDWEAFVDDWRYDGYMGGIGRVVRGELPFMTAGALHRRKLDALLDANGLAGIAEDERDALNRAWHRLDP
jgi:2-haloacid dehalogenase